MQKYTYMIREKKWHWIKGELKVDIMRREDESELSFIWRLCKAKDDGLLEVTWAELGTIFNKELIKDTAEYRTESAWRKKYQAAREFYDTVFRDMLDDKYLAEIRVEQENLKKERYRLADERTEYNRQIRVDARLEDRLDKLEESLKKSGEKDYCPFVLPKRENGEMALLVVLSDLHLGQSFNNAFGAYDSDIAKDRLDQYARAIADLSKQYDTKECFVSLQGDLISGNIHQSIAVSNRENVIEQVTLASELLTNFIHILSGVFEHITIKSVNGNHSRLTRKEDALKDERLDYIIPFVIGSKLSHIENITVDLGSNIDSTIAKFDILGKEYVSIHGDYDPYSRKGVADLSLFLGYKPYAMIFGHLHTPGFSEEFGIKMVRGGSFAGSGDDYTVEQRLIGNPCQTVCLCSEDGIKAVFPIEFE